MLHDYAEYRAEQVFHKRRDGGGGCEPAHVALERRYFFADTKLQGAFERHRIGDTATLGYLAMDFPVAKIEYGYQRSGGELLAGGGNGVHALRLTKRAQETLVRRGSAAEHK